jgi:hypothetical protein
LPPCTAVIIERRGAKGAVVSRTQLAPSPLDHTSLKCELPSVPPKSQSLPLKASSLPCRRGLKAAFGVTSTQSQPKPAPGVRVGLTVKVGVGDCGGGRLALPQL